MSIDNATERTDQQSSEYILRGVMEEVTNMWPGGNNLEEMLRMSLVPFPRCEA